MSDTSVLPVWSGFKFQLVLSFFLRNKKSLGFTCHKGSSCLPLTLSWFYPRTSSEVIISFPLLVTHIYFLTCHLRCLGCWNTLCLAQVSYPDWTHLCQVSIFKRNYREWLDYLLIIKDIMSKRKPCHQKLDRFILFFSTIFEYLSGLNPPDI